MLVIAVLLMYKGNRRDEGGGAGDSPRGHSKKCGESEPIAVADAPPDTTRPDVSPVWLGTSLLYPSFSKLIKWALYTSRLPKRREEVEDNRQFSHTPEHSASVLLGVAGQQLPDYCVLR